MLIDWKVILTQILGFLLTWWILSKFAWKPILSVLAERRERIRSEFAQIEGAKKDVAGLKADYEAQIKALDQQARQRLQEAVAEGQRVASEIGEKARLEAKEQVDRARAEIARESDKARVALKNDIVGMVVSATERVIQERLDEPKQKQKISEFLDQLSSVDARGKA